ncbi:hypothetical protein CDV31_000622 [Fusarium ambrosium]|uniref:Uncharacterized protein n=1 Tax=Fusarium ambrosium TaxID=131363 RepID=A0A428V1H9_9HYPO|nr:hypothetical protein CDV31_000622 [Fusarium ambrosium]
MPTTTLQQIRVSRNEPCWTCFSLEFNGMFDKLRQGENPTEWTVQPCAWRNDNTHIKCEYCSNHLVECARVPGLLEGNLRDLTNTIDFIRSLCSLAGDSPTGHALSRTAQTNMMRSLVKLAIGFKNVVSAHKGEHILRTGTQQALKPHLEKYQLKVDKRRQDFATGVLQHHPYPNDGLVRLVRDDREFFAWSSHVYEFYDNLTSGLEFGRVPEEAIRMIISHVPLVRPAQANLLPDVIVDQGVPMMNQLWRQEGGPN